MTLPAFNADGDLPPGVYPVALADALARLGASVFWATRSGAFGGEQAMIEYWQTRRDGRLRGILEIVPDQP